MRGVRIMLFSVLAATIAAVVALFITSNVERGPAHTFRLVPTATATRSQLTSDAAALVRRLQSLGYSDTQSQVVGDAISLTLYGSGPQVDDALNGAIAQARFEARPVECAVPPYSSGADSNLAERQPNGCALRYLLSAKALQVDTHTGKPRNDPGPDPSLAAVPDTSAATDVQSEPALYPAGSGSGFAGERLFLGPVRVGNDALASAGASEVDSAWVVQITLTSAGTKDLDALATQQFHAYLAICVDGTVRSVSIVQPTSTSFSSLGGQIQLRPGFTRSEALNLADDLTSPLAVPLEVTGSS
ncbi:MAG: SecDF P1 head subdomain-containing protein [Acidimicrobiales bacterium]